MRAEFPVSLSLEHVREKPAEYWLAAVKDWLVIADPPCLVHPHGFFVVPVCRTDIGDWRFHFWPKGERPVRGMPAFIHTHDRHVDSRILFGRLTNIIYDVTLATDDGLPLYEVGYGGDKYEKSTANVLRKMPSRVVASPLTAETLVAGQYYRVNRHAYHEALVPKDTCTATLVWMHDREPGPINVVGCDGYPDHIEFTRLECAGVDLAKLLPL